LVTGPKRSFTRSFFKRLQQEHLPWLGLSFFFELEDSPHVGNSIPSLATSAPQQIPLLNIPPIRTKVFRLVKLRLLCGCTSQLVAFALIGVTEDDFFA
jgi:hypothetical protein